MPRRHKEASRPLLSRMGAEDFVATGIRINIDYRRVLEQQAATSRRWLPASTNYSRLNGNLSPCTLIVHLCSYVNMLCSPFLFHVILILYSCVDEPHTCTMP